ncbi:RICIN domain-containing protein [Paenibacillus gyeongsangnamensis]|uniref:RICIN domain-containing protein n=1 Tax=Paenibacillus gyeongsangnamensis TaxID=3388067 RepID=UPI002FD407E9
MENQPMVIYTDSAAASQKFDFAPMGDGSFKIVSKGDPSMVLKVQSGIFASDQPVVSNNSYYLKNKSGIIANNNPIVINTWVDTAEMKWIEK